MSYKSQWTNWENTLSKKKCDLAWKPQIKKYIFLSFKNVYGNPFRKVPYKKLPIKIVFSYNQLTIKVKFLFVGSKLTSFCGQQTQQRTLNHKALYYT